MLLSYYLVYNELEKGGVFIIMNKNIIKVDKEKCTQCGLCVKVCRGVLGMGSDGPEVIRSLCIGCGQCVAICPEGALDNVNSPLVNQIPIKKMPVLDAATAAQFLRSRRSIRDFQQKPIPRAKLLQLLDIARIAPTACNSQGVAYHVVDSPDKLRAIAAVVIEWTEGELNNRDSAMANSPWTPNSAAQIEIYHQTGRPAVSTMFNSGDSGQKFSGSCPRQYLFVFSLCAAVCNVNWTRNLLRWFV
jgi:ferredoxin